MTDTLGIVIVVDRPIDIFYRPFQSLELGYLALIDLQEGAISTKFDFSEITNSTTAFNHASYRQDDCRYKLSSAKNGTPFFLGAWVQLLQARHTCHVSNRGAQVA